MSEDNLSPAVPIHSSKHKSKEKIKRVAIVGTAVSEMLAPFDDESWDIFCLAWNVPKYNRVTLAFEMHQFREAEDHGVDIIDHDSFPYDKTRDLPEPLSGDFFKSSIDYMIAYAIVNDYKEISIYGVDMAISDDEYFRQQPSIHAWIGFALGRGIKIWAHKSSPLMKSTYIYGRTAERKAIEPFTNEQFEALVKEHTAKIVEIDKQNKKLQAEIAKNQQIIDTHSGCVQSFDRLAKVARAIDAGQDIPDLSATAKII